MSAIFFDLDGTLTDPKVGITRSIQYALEKLNHDVPDMNQLIWCIGPPLLDSFEKMLGGRQLATTALDLYRERFADTGLYENDLYPGIIDALKSLGASGHQLFIATSKPTIYAKRIVEHFAIGEYFGRVFGSELDGAYSDKTELLNYALKETDVNPREAIMVGDRSHDMIGALRNGMKAVGVLYGYGSKDELVTAGAHRLSTMTQDLSKILS